MSTSAKVDWIACTVPKGWLGAFNYAPPSIKTGAYKEGGGHKNYTESRTYANGLIMMKNDHRDDMRAHVVYSAQTLGNIQHSDGLNGWDIIHWHLENDFTFTRLDLAIDAIGEEVDIARYHDLFHAGKKNTRIRTCKIIKEKAPETVCIGSMSTRKNFMRIYDKAIEQDIKELDWKRFELERRDTGATNTAWMLRNSGYTYECVAGLMRGCCDFPDDEKWNEIMSGGRIKVDLTPIKRNQTEAWLLNTCAKSLARQCTQNDDLLKEFLNEFGRYYSEYQVQMLTD